MATPHLTILASQVRDAGGAVFVGAPNGTVVPGPRFVFPYDTLGPDVYIAWENVSVSVDVVDDLGSDLVGPVSVIAPTAERYWSTATGEPDPEPPPTPLPGACVVADHETFLGAPGTTVAYFLVPHLDGWFMDWRTDVVDGMADSDGTFDGADTPVTDDVPLDALRVVSGM